MAQGRNFVTALMVGTASISMIVAGTTVPVAAQAATGNYRIESQPLSQALMQLSRQANVDIVAPAKITRGRVAKAVAAESVDAALRQMLAGSGLSYKLAGKRYVIQSGNVQGGASHPAGAPDRAPAKQSVRDVNPVPSASASTVVDARTGAALKGALVEIVETGENTSTGDLGAFRFPGKTGSYNLRISYLGYPEYEQYVDLKDGRASTGILLSDGSAAGEIVVTAYQSARAQAINQERTAENMSTVISDDLTGRFDGTTISEALRRAPGVAFNQDLTTGEGTNIIIRGMSSAFNTVTLNGVRLPANDGFSRSPSLNNILADSVSKITINKTLLPNQDGSGTGGLVEIETKGPLDRPSRYFNVSAEKAYASRNFLDETAFNGVASWKLGAAQNFGISVSAQYRKRSGKAISTTGYHFYGQYLPENDNGFPVTSLYDIDPRRTFPFEPGVGDIYQYSTGFLLNDIDVENLGLGASAQWSIGGHSELRLDYQRNQLKSNYVNRQFDFSTNSAYVPLPIADLNGQSRYALVWEDAYSPGLVSSVSHSYGTNDSEDVSSTLSFNGKTQIGSWEFDYDAGYAKGHNDYKSTGLFIAPDTFSRNFDYSHLNPEILANRIDGRIVSLYPKLTSSRVLFPGLNEAGYSVLSDPSGYQIYSAQDQIGGGSNERISASFDVKKTFESKVIKYLQVGFFYENSLTKQLGGRIIKSYSTSASLDQLGINFSDNAFGMIGQPGNLSLISRSDLLEFFSDLRAGSNLLVTTNPADPNSVGMPNKNSEEDLAAYFQSHLQFGKLEIIGGMRFERVKNTARTTYSASIIDSDGSFDQAFYDANRVVASFSGNDTTFLPRVTANYRFSENAVLRLGYYQSIARPSILDLSNSYTVNLNLVPDGGPMGTQPTLTIFRGNPDLKASLTHSLDASFEWYFDTVGVLKAGAFYKATKNPFTSNVTLITRGEAPDVDLPDDPRFDTPDLYVVDARPANSGETTKLWGVELALERRLDFLPGWLNGFGIYANYTYTKGSREACAGYYRAPEGRVCMSGIPYLSQPPHSGTAALTYSRDGLNGSVGYTAQAALRSGFPSYGFMAGASPVETLDAKLSYDSSIGGAKVRLYVEGSNLLKGPQDPTLSYSAKNSASGAILPTSDSYIGGRTIRLGLSASF